MKRSTWQWASQYFREYGTSVEVIKHSLKVNEIANFFAQKAIEKKIIIDLDLVDKASIIHDFYRGVTDKDHQKKGGEILAKEDFRLGRIVAIHGLKSILDKNAPYTIEEKIVFLADKLVLHDSGVILDVGIKIDQKPARQWREEAKVKVLKMLDELFFELGTSAGELWRAQKKN